MSATHFKKLQASMSPEAMASRNRRIARAVRSGVAISTVARQQGLHHKAVRAICEEMGVLPPDRTKDAP